MLLNREPGSHGLVSMSLDTTRFRASRKNMDGVRRDDVVARRVMK